MLNAMIIGKNAIEALDAAIKISQSDIANMYTPGYKGLDASFQSIFERYLSQGSAAYNGMGGTNPRQLGQGMSLSQISVDMSAGDRTAGRSLDMFINGPGFFVVSPDGGDTSLYSRMGRFSIDASGNLTSNGLVVYGLDTTGNLVPVSGLTFGDDSNYSWGTDGTLNYSGTSTGYQIALTYFPNPEGLLQAQGTSFRETVASGSAQTATAPGGAAGSIIPRYYEASNVSFYNETLETTELRNALNANLTLVTMASEIISNVINKLS